MFLINRWKEEEDEEERKKERKKERENTSYSVPAWNETSAKPETLSSQAWEVPRVKSESYSVKSWKNGVLNLEPTVEVETYSCQVENERNPTPTRVEPETAVEVKSEKTRSCHHTFTD